MKRQTVDFKVMQARVSQETAKATILHVTKIERSTEKRTPIRLQISNTTNSPFCFPFQRVKSKLRISTISRTGLSGKQRRQILCYDTCIPLPSVIYLW